MTARNKILFTLGFSLGGAFLCGIVTVGGINLLNWLGERLDKDAMLFVLVFAAFFVVSVITLTAVFTDEANKDGEAS